MSAESRYGGGAHAASAWWAEVRAANGRDYGVLVVFFVLALALAATSDVFLTQRNLINTLASWAPTGIMACGLTLVTIAGGFDLSVSAIYALAGIISVEAVIATGSPFCGAVAAVAVRPWSAFEPREGWVKAAAFVHPPALAQIARLD